MTTEQKIQAINSLCLTNQYSELNRLFGDVPGAFAILISDRPAEAKRQELLKLLKGGSKA